MCYWILYYGVVAYYLVSHLYTCVLRQILVFIRRFPYVPFTIVHFLSLIFSNPLLYSQVVLYPCASSPPSIRGGLSQKWKCGWNLTGECLCVRTMQSWNEVITVPNSTMSLMHTIVPGSTMDLGIELCVVPCNTTLQPQLQSGH